MAKKQKKPASRLREQERQVIRIMVILGLLGLLVNFLLVLVT